MELLHRPLGLFFWGNVWTLAAWCELRTDFRNFRLDRIQRLNALSGTFSECPGQGLTDFLALMQASRPDA
ncbi:MAG: WYL domain-containing protein [Thiothrix sp.]|nr:WYL domain-containing protein [Thiothrix sp.]